MAFTGTTYAQIKAGADTVAELIGNHQTRLADSKSVASAIVSSLTALSTEYESLPGAADALLATDPTDLGKQVLKSDIENLLENFNAALAEAQALDALINT